MGNVAGTLLIACCRQTQCLAPSDCRGILLRGRNNAATRADVPRPAFHTAPRSTPFNAIPAPLLSDFHGVRERSFHWPAASRAARQKKTDCSRHPAIRRWIAFFEISTGLRIFVRFTFHRSPDVFVTCAISVRIRCFIFLFAKMRGYFRQPRR